MPQLLKKMLTDERGTSLQVINDVRRSALIELQARALQHWQQHAEQGYFASQATIDTGSKVLRHGCARAASRLPAPRHQHCLSALVCDPRDAAAQRVQPVMCSKPAASFLHLHSLSFLLLCLSP